MAIPANDMIPAMPPQFITDIYSQEENDILFKILRENGPWKSIISLYFNSVDELNAVSQSADSKSKGGLSDFLTPAFRGFFGNNGLVYEPEAHDIFYSKKLLDMVKNMHGAQYGAPYLFQFNIQGPAHGLDPGHFDGRSWRGMDPTNTPAWLGSIMAKSGLFSRWEVKAGQVISYYYDSDIDGGFTYWPRGLYQPPERFAPPLWNAGTLANNQQMYHRGEACGDPQLRGKYNGMTISSVIQADGDEGWKVTENGKDILRYENKNVRILFHYSAHVFDDMADLKRYYDHSDDLTPEMAFDMLIVDLKRRNIAFQIPSNPLSDHDFIKTLNEVYQMFPKTYHKDAPLYR